jgi:hypothetical protein
VQVKKRFGKSWEMASDPLASHLMTVLADAPTGHATSKELAKAFP